MKSFNLIPEKLKQEIKDWTLIITVWLGLIIVFAIIALLVIVFIYTMPSMTIY